LTSRPASQAQTLQLSYLNVLAHRRKQGILAEGGVVEMDTITVQLPLDILQAAKVPEDQATTEVKKIIVLFLYDRGTISLAKACELLGISQWEFFELNKAFGLTVHYDIEDYREDLETLRRVAE
jgi:predicted HTH domain antitoxin